MNRILRRLSIIFDLRSELEDYDLIHGDIEKGIQFRGTNLWILMFAIVVASVGLNMNSTAVIIGAMLISPLMGPINGMGYSLATYDLPLLQRSFKNFAYAVIVSLITSAIYFFISPINEAHSELLARTTPTIYDVLIALFGGLAGIVAISSKLKGNVIPGVAIATALMPPICTAGYGLATWQLNFFFGALYLFTINTVFIAVAAFMVSQYLKFPKSKLLTANRRKQMNRLVVFVIMITAFPSIYFGYQLVQNENFKRNTHRFFKEVAFIEGNYLQREQADTKSQRVELIYSGYGLSAANFEQIKQIALTNHIDTAKLLIHQGFEATFVQESTKKMQSESDRLNQQLSDMNYKVKMAERRVDSVRNIPEVGQVILKEITALYPQIKGCTYSETFSFSTEQDSLRRSDMLPMVIFDATRNSVGVADQRKIKEWLQNRLEVNKVRVIYDY